MEKTILLAKIAEQLGKAPFASYDNKGNLVLLALMAKASTHIPEEVWQCRSLQELRLGGFQLDQFPADIEQLTQLRSLRIVSSTIGAFPARKIGGRPGAPGGYHCLLYLAGRA